jgi:DNA-binding NtrC family response regulator
MAGERPVVRLVAVDDDPAALDLVRAALDEEGIEILTETDPARGLDLILRQRPQIVLLDLFMPGMCGMELLQRITEACPETDVILVTANYSTDAAVEAIQKGACDYITKPVSVDDLVQRVGRLAGEARRRQKALELDDELLRASHFQDMVGRSPLMLEVFARIRRVAPHFRSALITGATGTGKELAAAALHRLSPVAANRFVVCNSSAVVETLFESELFGHVKGAFTGATQDKPGLMEHANGGSMFLDEIGDMPLSTQAKLLRALQNQEIQRVGSLAIRKVDVRVIAATHRDLRKMVAEGKFREDLFYRLSRVEIKLPRLADRREDLVLLARHFIERFAAEYGKSIRGMTPRAQVLLARHEWPGNIRELENVLSEACMMVTGERIDVCDLPAYMREAGSKPEMDAVREIERAVEEMLPLEEVHRRYCVRVLETVRGNKARAAKILGINRATLYRVLGERGNEAESNGE